MKRTRRKKFCLKKLKLLAGENFAEKRKFYQ